MVGGWSMKVALRTSARLKSGGRPAYSLGGAPVAAFVAGSLSVRHPINGDARYSEVRPDRLADGLGIRRLKVSSGIDSKADAAYAQDPSCAIESTWKSGTVVLPPACVS